VDSGSGVSLIQPGVYDSEVRHTSTSPFGVTGEDLDTLGEQDVQFSLDNLGYKHTFCVFSLPTEADGILGTDLLLQMNTTLDLGKQELRLQKRPMSNQSFSGRRIGGARNQGHHVAFTSFPNVNGKQYGRKRASKAKERNGETKEVHVFRGKNWANSRDRRADASRRHAEAARSEKQYGDQQAKRREKCYIKRRIDRRKSDEQDW
jgi:hypothetical protein